MSRILPKLNKQEIVSLNGSQNEATVYEYLKSVLSDDYLVLYSVPWLEERKGMNPVNGEADFVVINRNKGLITIEVKGGSIEASPGYWYTRLSDGTMEKMRSPILQALRSRKIIESSIRKIPGHDLSQFSTGHCIILANTTTRVPNLGLDASPEIILYADELKCIDTRINSVFKFWTGNKPRKISNEAVEAISEKLLPTRIIKPSLGAQAIKNEEAFINLTHWQSKYLSLLNYVKKACIVGGAGTGKTVLALEKSKKLAQEGHETLLVCFNRPLYERLYLECRNINNLTVSTYEDLCKDFITQADLEWPSDGSLDSKFYDQEMPSKMLDALNLLPERRFDAILVDESQDLPEDSWINIQLLLRSYDKGILYAFTDPAQLLYQPEDYTPEDLNRFLLNENIRNTKSICHASLNFCKHPQSKTIAVGPEGIIPDFIECENDLQIKNNLGRILHRLIVDQGFKENEVVILSPHNTANKIFNALKTAGRFKITNDIKTTGDIKFESVWRFKGLESKAVVLIKFDEKQSDYLRYVSMTRAQSYLAVLGTKNELEKFTIERSL